MFHKHMGKARNLLLLFKYYIGVGATTARAVGADNLLRGWRSVCPTGRAVPTIQQDAIFVS